MGIPAKNQGKFAVVNTLLNTTDSTVLEQLNGRQGDNGRVAYFALKDGNLPHDISNQTVVITVKDATGKIKRISGVTDVISATGGLFEMTIPAELYQAAGGTEEAYMSVEDNTGVVVSSIPIKFNVLENNIIFTANGSQDYIDSVQKMIDEIKLRVDPLGDRIGLEEDRLELVKKELKDFENNVEAIIDTQNEVTDFKISDMLNMTFDTIRERGVFFDNEFADRGVNVKWFGAVGDGISNDTEAFKSAYNVSKNIYVPSGIYSLNELHVPEDTIIKGDNATIELRAGGTGSNNVLAGSQSNSVITGLKIHSLEENIEWNRFDVSEQSNVIIRNCEFVGFRHAVDAPNAWGIYLDHSKQVVIENCRFDNNSQADIAIVDGCEDIKIINCSGINDTFYINFEPNNFTDPIKRVSISNSILSKVSLRNYFLTNQNFEQIAISSSVIDYLDHYGADVEFINSKIHHVSQPLSVTKPTDNSTISSGGVLKLNGALNLSGNLVVDPTMDSYATVEGSDANWITAQGTLNASSGTTRYEDKFGTFTRIGTKTTDRAQMLFTPKLLLTAADNGHKHSYQVSSGDQFLATLSGWAHYGESASWISNNAAVAFYGSDGKVVSELHLSLCKAEAGTDSSYNNYSVFITVPEKAVSMTIKVGDSTVATSPTVLYFGAFALQKVLPSTDQSNGDINLNPLPVRSRRSFRASSYPTSAYGWCHYQEGDICYNSTPTKGQPYGWICVNQGYPGDWLPLGNI